jgi:hypothetical protein
VRPAIRSCALTHLGVITALQKLKPAALVLATLAGVPWWLLALAGLLTLYFYGAEPAMRWLDVIDRMREGRRR